MKIGFCTTYVFDETLSKTNGILAAKISIDDTEADIHRGWSLGGLIALEIASLLSQTAEFDLLGLVMIDSICPKALKQHQSRNIVPHGPLTTSRCRPEINFLISTQLKASAKIVEDWTMPSWSPPPFPAFEGQDWTRITALERSKKGFSSASSSSSSSSTSLTPLSRNNIRSRGTAA